VKTPSTRYSGFSLSWEPIKSVDKLIDGQEIPAFAHLTFQEVLVGVTTFVGTDCYRLTSVVGGR